MRLRVVFAAGLLLLVGLVGFPPNGSSQPANAQSCDPNYLPCVPPYPPDVDCSDLGFAVRIIGIDVHSLDSNGDGTGCESYGTPPPPPAAPVCRSEPVSEGAPLTFFPLGRFFPLSPARLLDTRFAGGGLPVCPDGTITLQVTGHAGIPDHASAVALNVTAAEAQHSGFVTVWPAGTPRPDTSSVNLSAAGQTRPNLVLVALSPSGAVSLYSSHGAHLIIDVAGYFMPSQATAGGRLVSVTPTRVLDTRLGNGAPATIVGAGETLTVAIAGRGGVPTSGVSAVAMNVTAADALAAGFVTAWPAGRPRPDASVLNLAGPGDVAPNLVILPLGDGGAVNFFTERGANIIADVVGYFTDDSAPVSLEGLFAAVNPSRLFDTRNLSPIPPGETFVAEVRAGGVEAVALNVTGVDATARGFVTVFPSTSPRPDASTLNLEAGDTRANQTLMRLGTDSKVAFFSEAGTDLLADITGFFAAPIT